MRNSDSDVGAGVDREQSLHAMEDGDATGSDTGDCAGSGLPSPAADRAERDSAMAIDQDMLGDASLVLEARTYTWLSWNT